MIFIILLFYRWVINSFFHSTRSMKYKNHNLQSAKLKRGEYQSYTGEYQTFSHRLTTTKLAESTSYITMP